MSTNTKDKLLRFFQLLDDTLSKDLNIVVLGGTALTLWDVKTYSLDVDTILVDKDYPSDFADTYMSVARECGVIVEHPPFVDFDCSLLKIPDFFRQAKPYKEVKYKHLKIYTMSPEDIIISKFNRGLKKDREDIEAMLMAGLTDKHKLNARYNAIMREQYFEFRPVVRKKQLEFFQLYKHILG